MANRKRNLKETLVAIKQDPYSPVKDYQMKMIVDHINRLTDLSTRAFKFADFVKSEAMFKKTS